MSNSHYQPTGLSETIFKDRYAIHPEESWDNASKRLSRHVASVEPDESSTRIEESFYEEIVTNRFMPGGRIWYGSGRPRAQLLNCWASSTPVITENGVMPISEIVVGDRVLTEDGTFQNVINVFTQGFREQLLSVKVDRMPNSIAVTEDHKILTKRGWIEAQNLTTEDYVSVPGYRDSQPVPEYLELLSFVDERKWGYSEINGQVYQNNSGNSKNSTTGVLNAQVKAVNSRIPVTLDFAKFLGYYISEGCAEKNGHRVIFTFSADEENYGEETKELFEDLFGVKARVDHRGTWIQVSVSSKIINQFMTNLIGPSFDTKKLPWWVLNTSDEFKMTLLAYACRGDAHTNLETGSTLLTMCNPTSMQQMFFIAQDLGLAYSLKYGIPRESHHAMPVSLNLAKVAAESSKFTNFHELLGKINPIEERYWRKVVSVNTTLYNDLVWDISVETNHSLQVSGGIVGKNCFVIPTADSREGWGKTISDVIVVSGMGGGVGVNCSPIRPRGSKIQGTGGIATGAVSLMEMINAVGDVLVAGGGRRLALMLDLNISHPDMPEFLDKKLNRKELTNANVSIIIDKKVNSETFVEKVRSGNSFDLMYGTQARGSVNAKEIWEKIVNNAWNSGEPGVLNGDLANRESNIYYYKPLVSTNPCGEIWLEEYGCCDLGALVLPRFVNSYGAFDFEQFARSIDVAVRFLDNVLSVNEYPLPEIRDNCNNVRRIGLGIMGLHSMLIQMGLAYSSRAAKDFVDELMNFLKIRAYKASIELAKEKGAFPAFDEKMIYSGFIQRAIPKDIQEDIRTYGIRNCALLTIAPTGTTGMVSNVSTGIEPLFAPAYWRRFYRPTADGSRQLDKELVVDPLWEMLEHEGKDVSVLEGAYDIDPVGHFDMQRICQDHIDNAASKTINLPENYPVESLSDLWLEYLPSLKGTTFYRAGSRGEEPLEAIPLAEARRIMAQKEHKHLDATITDLNSMDCPDGVCEIPEEFKPHISEAKYELAMV